MQTIDIWTCLIKQEDHSRSRGRDEGHTTSTSSGFMSTDSPKDKDDGRKTSTRSNPKKVGMDKQPSQRSESKKVKIVNRDQEGNDNSEEEEGMEEEREMTELNHQDGPMVPEGT